MNDFIVQAILCRKTKGMMKLQCMKSTVQVVLKNDFKPHKPETFSSKSPDNITCRIVFFSLQFGNAK
ncbi:hypothetical protein [Pseudomonas poae]|uniref:hypothetical protein n=1 Tax=Pseudomonas poae TaxID=200451 RepID=UPI001145EB15|nr:hypothetical protein [Pseudomonas poae]